MANVTFSGSNSYYLYLGGIAGYLSSYDYKIYAKNCANYGSVTHSGTSYRSYIGGIVGELANSYYKHIYNCLNYGTITHSGTTSNTLYLGDIVGYAKYTYIENCVSAGMISLPNTANKNFIGSLIGEAGSYTHVKYCYYTDGLNGYNMYGSGSSIGISNTLSYSNNTFELSENVYIDDYFEYSLIDALNAASDYYMLRGYSHWMLNKDNKIISFTVNSRTNPINMDFQIILLPNLANEGNISFDGWYNDSEHELVFNSPEVGDETSLYGKFEINENNYTITYITRGGASIDPITAQFGITVSLPSSSTKESCIIAFWENIHGDIVGFSFTMIDHNITLYAVWKCTHIETPDDFLEFSKVVNSGNSYLGTTVFLDSDLSLTGYDINPIGTSSRYQFRGIFDGQGYIVSNLKITNSSSYVGLFGYSSGLTIRNVALDSSCSITNSYSGSYDVYIGGIIGYCISEYGQCNIENNVNMASVTFSGSISSYSLYLGGIAGYLSSSKYNIYVKNCANYGSVTHSGKSEDSYIGGIVGYLDNWYYVYSYKYVYNCLNYGTITHSGKTSSSLNLGGIAGYTRYAYIGNCVGAGTISSSSKSYYIGSLVGTVGSYTHVNYCYYTDGLSGYNMYGSGTPTSTYCSSYNSDTFELNETVSISNYSGNSLLDALNAASDYYMLRGYSHWLLNKNNKTIYFTINGRTNPIKMDYQIILLPSLASERNISFDGWYTNGGCTTPLASYEVTATTTSLYGNFKQNTNYYTITFNTRGGTLVSPIQAQFGTTVSLPSNTTRDYCTVISWENAHGDNVGFNLIIPAQDITLYAVWMCTHIETPDDFFAFSKVVNSGTSYCGTTVFLDSDLSLTGYDINPIGTSYQFCGVFDGQGYVISNLKIIKSSRYMGLFGRSWGLTIKNVILDSSCSITNTYIGSGDVYVGGIIGNCESDNRKCNIENNVNMASVSFSGSISSGYNLYLGGIAGYFYSSNNYYYNIYVKNCANYGSVTHSGTSDYSYIGGIVGNFASLYYNYIYNCLNYGTITHSDKTSSSLNLGGIAGRAYYAYIENCVSAGIISSLSKSYVGSLVGSVNSYTYINYCYYTDGLNSFKMYGSGTPTGISNAFSYSSNTFALSKNISISNNSEYSLIDALNAASDYYVLRGYSRWMLNKNNKSVSFTINGRGNPIKMDYQIIPFPSLASEESISFDGWYTNGGCTTPLMSYEITTDTSLYGKFEQNTNYYTITFDTRGGIPVSPIQAQFGTIVSLPNSTTRDYCTIISWENVHVDNFGFSFTMPAYNITLYAVWKCTHIETLDDFFAFSKVVCSGTSYYYGTTVYLDSDLFLHEVTDPIGRDSNYNFRGVFDGQGYVISNLTISSSSYYVGLFGYSSGLTIRNVVLGSSCSITNTFVGYGAYVGGIIGYCYSSSNYRCNIENNVNMASVTFSGDISSGIYNSLYLGGIAGYLWSYSNNNVTVENCANYGSIIHSGTSYSSYIGGIVGYLYTSYSYYKYVYNCFNYGTITHSGTTYDTLYLGGIAGYTKYAYIENCVSAGTISSPSKYVYIGSLVGKVDSYTYVNYTYYTNDVGNYTLYGSGTPTSNSNTPNTSSRVNQTLIINLNSKMTPYNGWNKWFLNLNNETIIFKVNNNNGFSLSSQIVLLPDLISNNSFVFSRWHTDPYYNDLFQSDEVFESMTLYSLYGVIVNVTFNTTGENVTVTSKSIAVNSSYGELPTPNMTGYTFTGWFTEDNVRIINETKVSITSNHIIYAQWTINNYTITFNFSNGTNPEMRVLDYNSTIIYPNITEREGYTSKWNSGKIDFMPAKNITINAQWIPNNYTVTYIFNNKEGKKEITFYYNETIAYPDEGVKRGYSFTGWSPKFEFMPAYNFTAHGCWIPNNYTVALDANGGSELDEDEITVTFNNTYENLPAPNKIGYTFIGWLVTNGTDDENIGNEENIIVHKDDTVNITSNCIFVVLWVVNNYTVTFKYSNDENKNYTLSYGVPIEANVSSPSKPFYSFDKWCTDDGKICTPDGKVPAEDIILFPHFTINAAAVSGTAVGIVAFPFLVLLVIVLIFIILMAKNGMKVGHEAADVEMTFVNNDGDGDDARLIQQMEATKISEDLEAKLMKHIKSYERNKTVNEVLDNLGIDASDNKYGITESFKVAGVSSVISKGIFSGTNLSAVSSYLSLLYTTVREQEEFEEFKKLYFGMKDVNAFIDGKDEEEEISFGNIISGFTDKKKVISLLSENEEDNLPRGVLFKVENGKGYNVGGQDEILFEVNSKFRIERVEEIIKRKYVVVKLSYVFPNSDNEMIVF